MQNKALLDFIKEVRSHHQKYGRHTLPWRITRDPYRILVSEIMLQQTQVDRVIPYFEKWIKVFPTLEMLAGAPLSEVLREWQGLGYNRRGKLVRECAKQIVEKHGGTVPRGLAALTSLPGIGPYTAGAIRAFAFDEKEVFIETNIRAALIHYFFPRSKKVSDTKLIPILTEILLHVESPRIWYSALMDYGAFIKKAHPNPSRRSAHHTRQPKFEGSLRQMRGALIRRLLAGPLTQGSLLKVVTANSYRVEQALKSLAKDGMVVQKRGRWLLAAE